MRLAICAALAALASPALACEDYDAAVAAVNAGDSPAAAGFYEAVSTDPACDDAFREWLGDYLARESYREAVEGAGSPTDKRAALERALGYEAHWRTQAEIGRLDWEAGDYPAAAARFQLAINELVEGDPTHAASEEEIALLYRLASAAMALSDEPVEVPVTRSGSDGGIFATKIRGFEVEEVPLPITFEFDSTTFDETGARYAEALAEHVLRLSPDRITLAGHTDPSGPEDYNLALSVARAEAVGAFLAERGYTGTVEVEGFGETMLPEPPPGIEPGSDAHYRIARRVAFRAE